MCFVSLGRPAIAMPIAFLQGGPQLRDDPVFHFRLVTYQAYLARTWSNEVDSILTSIPATFLVAEREVSQNGIFIRVIRNMESFERPPKSVPLCALGRE